MLNANFKQMQKNLYFKIFFVDFYTISNCGTVPLDVLCKIQNLQQNYRSELVLLLIGETYHTD